jgi:hypothetical protein
MGQFQDFFAHFLNIKNNQNIKSINLKHREHFILYGSTNDFLFFLKIAMKIKYFLLKSKCLPGF